MKKLYLHIGSHKTGTTSLQSTFHKNRSELKTQGFLYPGNEANHHKLFFITNSPEKDWPRQFKKMPREILESEIKEYMPILERDLKSNYYKQIISSEYLFIDEVESIKNAFHYLCNFFSDIVVYIFVRDPVGFYISAQQQMIKARSYITPPDRFRYRFKSVIEAWKQFCDVHVNKYSSKNDACNVFCDNIGINHTQLSPIGHRANVSLSIEQMVLLEKIQRVLYPCAEDVFKPHLRAIDHIDGVFSNKPRLKESAVATIIDNHKEDLEWLEETYSIDFLHEEWREWKSNAKKQLYPQRVTIREVYHVDEKAAEMYEAFVMDFLLKHIGKSL